MCVSEKGMISYRDDFPEKLAFVLRNEGAADWIGHQGEEETISDKRRH